MTNGTIVDNISALVEELGAPGTTKAAMDDPGGHEGPSSHPSAKTDDPGEQSATEGARSAENTKDVKEDIPESVDSKTEATPGNAPTQDEVQLGQGVDSAKPTGEDSSNERDYKGDKEDPPAGSGTDQGGTTHPASGDFGDKYSSDKLAGLSNEALFKTAADLGNEMAADIANGHFNAPSEKRAMKKLTHCSNCHKDYEGDSCSDCGGKQANDQGHVDANQAAAAGEEMAKMAAAQEMAATQVITNIVKHAHYRADLLVSHLRQHHAELQKQAMGPEEDPTGGEAEGEDHGSEAAGGPGDGGEGAPGGGGDEIAALLAGGGGPEGAPPEGDPMGGDPMGGDPMGGGPEGMPPELGGMGNEDALQQLAMALMELGIDPAELAAIGGPEAQGPKIASAVENHRRSGKFEFTQAKTAGERKVRDYMKGVIREIHSRSNR